MRPTAGAGGHPAPPPGTPYGAPAAPSQGTNGLAVGSLILGILSFFCVGLIAGPIAIVLGFLGRKKANEEMAGNGAGMALAGIITGALGFAVSLVFVLFTFVFTESVVNELDDINSDPSDGICNEDRFWQDPDC